MGMCQQPKDSLLAQHKLKKLESISNEEKKHLSKGETKRVKDSVVLKAVLKVLYFILILIFIFRWSRTKTFRSQAKIYFHVNAMAAVRRLLLLISANNRPTTLFRFESSTVTAMGKMVDN